jgi:hypothetical protein
MPFPPISENFCRMYCIQVSKSSCQKSWAPGVRRTHGGGREWQIGCSVAILENTMDQVDDAGVRSEPGTK